jgi:hypothetical protein
MFMMKFKWGIAALLAGASIAAVTSSAHAGVLTFDGNICNGGTACNDYNPIDQGYGSTATVNVLYNRDITDGTLSLGAANSTLKFWDTGYNQLLNIAWGGSSDAAGTPEIFLSPTAGNSVTLTGFDLGAWFHTSRGSQVTIVDGLNNVLYSSGPIVVGTGDLANHFAFNLTSSNGIGIEWGPSGYNVGIDNVAFSDGSGAVPEPAAWVMMIAGFGVIGAGLRSSKVTTRVRFA